MFKALLQLAIILSVSSTLLAQRSLTNEQRDEFLQDMVKSFETEFLWEEEGKVIANKLRAKIENGDYAGLKDAELFTATFSRDLFSLSRDRHLSVWVKPSETEDNSALQTEKPRSVFTSEDIGKGIYYLKFDMFPRLNGALEVEIEEIMASFDQANAIIIDLRDNGGGADQTANHLAGYFFDEKTRLATSYQWGQDPQDVWATPKSTSNSLAKTKPIILTSQASFSAAEAFTQRLQFRQRAFVIGEKTPGAVHRSATYLMNDLFMLQWPYERSVDASQQKDIEGIGISPDLYAHYDEAKTVAIDYLKNQGPKSSVAVQKPNEDRIVREFLYQINSKIIDQEYLSDYLTSAGQEKVLSSLMRFKTVWNEDLNAQLNNVHHLEEGNLRLFIQTTFGELVMKLIMEDGGIDGLMYRL